MLTLDDVVNEEDIDGNLKHETVSFENVGVLGSRHRLRVQRLRGGNRLTREHDR